MTAQQALQRGVNLLHAGKAREAEAVFVDVWNSAGTTVVQRYLALKGVTRALDAQGRWHYSETLFEEHFAGLRSGRRHHLQDTALLNAIASGQYKPDLPDPDPT